MLGVRNISAPPSGWMRAVLGERLSSDQANQAQGGMKADLGSHNLVKGRISSTWSCESFCRKEKRLNRVLKKK